MNADTKMDGESERATPMSEPTPRERRCFRFSLRTMLLTSMLIAAVFGWTVREVREQAIAVAALEEMGCRVHYDDSVRPETIVEWLRKIVGEAKFRNIDGVDCSSSKTNDSGLAP